MSPDATAPDKRDVLISAPAAYVLCMRKAVTLIAVLSAAISLTSCGGGSSKASRDCLGAWNAASNKAGQSAVAGRFRIASVSKWRAESGGSGNVDLGGPASEGCGYLFHTSKRYVSISGVWDGETIRWGVPPSIHGSWSARQQAAVTDGVTVDAEGLLSTRKR
jgi:hypothetical protein